MLYARVFAESFFVGLALEGPEHVVRTPVAVDDVRECLDVVVQRRDCGYNSTDEQEREREKEVRSSRLRLLSASARAVRASSASGFL